MGRMVVIWNDDVISILYFIAYVQATDCLANLDNHNIHHILPVIAF